MKSTFLATAAFLCGVGASYLAFRWIGERNESPPTVGAQADDHPVEDGAKPNDDITTKDAFEDLLPPGHVPVVVETSAESVAGGRPTNPRYNVIISKRNDPTRATTSSSPSVTIRVNSTQRSCSRTF